MSKFVSWRDLLSDVISSVPERERMAKEMGVRSITLIRWATGESIPRQQNLQQLLLAFPSALHAEFLALLKEDAFSTFLSEREEVFPEISYAFGRKVLRTRANTPDNLIFWTLCRLILRQALKQLDPKGRGMSINVVRCMAPDRAGHVRTLLESIGLGTAPWRSDLEPKGVLLGSESLSGYATTVCRLQYIQDVRVNDGLLPVQYRSHAVSVAACPIMYAGRTAGCLALASTQPDYFSSEVVQELLYGYADLLALAFGPREFYRPEDIQLTLVPPVDVQQTYLAGFRQRVNTILLTSVHTSQPLTSIQAEQVAWQQIEEELLAPQQAQELSQSR